jgi:hypothetical protein
MTTESSTQKDHPAQAAALRLVRDGLASPSEAAQLAGVSRQLAGHWITAAGINWRKARSTALTKAWRRAMRD